MNEAATTWALIVGIDEYDDPAVPRLQGAAADALAAFRWLLDLGVPGSQILLHAAPSAATKPALDSLRPGCPGATAPEINRSIVALESVVGGTRLFVFLSGHGLYEPTSRRLFLTQEFTMATPMNMGLDLYIERFRAMPSFDRQFVFVDGCQNLPYSQSQRQKIQGQMFGGATGFTPRPQCALVACYAAALDQLAMEVNGRGLFSRYLFAGLVPSLDAQHPCPQAVDLDFDTAACTVDLRKLIYHYVEPNVRTEAARQSPPIHQNPQIQVEGRGQGEPASPIFRLPEGGKAPLHVRVEPPAALADVERIRISVEEPPWDKRLPVAPKNGLTLPVDVQLPVGFEATVSCRMRAGTAWIPRRAEQTFEVLGEQHVTFSLASPPSQPPEGSIRIETKDAAGETVSNMFNYDDVARRIGFRGSVARGAEVAHGVRMFKHEHGPSFAVRKRDLAQGRVVASRWAEAIRTATPSDVGVSIVFDTPAEPGDNLRIVLPAGGPESLAGFVSGRPAVWAGALAEAPTRPLWRGVEGARSLEELRKGPRWRLEPGPSLVRLELPWGTWNEIVRVPAAGEVAVDLPPQIGTPPLRVALRAHARRRRAVVVGVTEPGPAAGNLRHGLGRPAERELRRTTARGAAWAIELPRAGAPNPIGPADLLVLDGGKAGVFPVVGGRSFAVDHGAGGLRVEPLSTVPSPAWDLLLASGRLDVLDREDASALAKGKWEDWLLGLAGAYAIHSLASDPGSPSARRDRQLLAEALGNLRGLNGPPSPDLDLLWMSSQRSAAGRRWKAGLPKAYARQLRPWAEAGAVPLLRWGLPLAIQLLELAPGDAALDGWRAALVEIEARLSPISVWTAWTEAPS